MKVSAGPFVLEIPPNGVAILYQTDAAGTEHQLPGGVGYLEALIQFAGEVMRLRERCAQSDVDILIETGRNEALEAAAGLCECGYTTGSTASTLKAIAVAIRALKGQP